MKLVWTPPGMSIISSTNASININNMQCCLDINNHIQAPTYFDSKSLSFEIDIKRRWSKFFSCKGLNMNRDWIETSDYAPLETIALT